MFKMGIFCLGHISSRSSECVPILMIWVKFQMTLISSFLLMTPIFSFELLQRMLHIQKQMISLKKFLTT